MTAESRVDLERPRELSALLSDATRLSLTHWRTFLLASLVIVVPVEAAVSGFGLGQFSAGYDATPAPAQTLIPALVRLLVIGPLMAVIALYALLELSEGRTPRPWQAIQSGLDAFAPVFWPVLMSVALVIVTAPLIVVPFVLLVRLYFVPLLVAHGGARGTAALRASWELTRGVAWRTAGMLLVVYLLFSLVSAFIGTPLAVLAKNTDSQAVALAGQVLGDVIVAAPVAVVGAFLYFDLRLRARARTA